MFYYYLSIAVLCLISAIVFFYLGYVDKLGPLSALSGVFMSSVGILAGIIDYQERRM